MQVKGASRSFRELAYHLHPNESLGQERRACQCIRCTPKTAGLEAVSIASTSIKVHPDGTGALKNGGQSIGKSRGGWRTKIHLIAADARIDLKKRTICLWTGHTKVLKPVSWFLILGCLQSFLQRKIDWLHGSTISRCTSDATKSSACSAGLKGSVESSPDLRRSM